MTIIESQFTLKEIGGIVNVKIKPTKPTNIVFKKRKVTGEKFRGEGIIPS